MADPPLSGSMVHTPNPVIRRKIKEKRVKQMETLSSSMTQNTRKVLHAQQKKVSWKILEKKGSIQMAGGASLLKS